MMRRIHLKGDVLCTLLLLLLLCLVLYAQHGFQLSWRLWSTAEKATSSRALLKIQETQDNQAPCQAQPPPPSRPASAPRGATPTGKITVAQPPFDFRRYLEKKDCREFKLLIDQPTKCSGGQMGAPFLLIAIKSMAADFDKRQVVRHTWGQELTFQDGAQVKTIFLLGVPQNQSELPLWDKLLAYESQTFRDILLWDFEDTFFNLTLKETHFLKWVNCCCSDVKFIFKGDADVYVNVENILEMLRGQEPSRDLFVGDIIVHARPIRRRASKYFIPETVYGLGIYPSYAGGGGFVMSGFTAHRLHKACQEVELFPIDDVFLGMCLLRIGLQPVRHEGFRTFGIMRPSAAPHLQVFNPCFYRELMVVHSLTVPQIWLMWNLLHDPHLRCHSQQTHTSSLFRWKERTQTTAKAKGDQDYSIQLFARH
ncbi:UDP-GlcNAc:betaGal beta-1,3-N-acetylglucosaminyltransferase 9 [Arapaima gigas]